MRLIIQEWIESSNVGFSSNRENGKDLSVQ
jgi:hypothetical protein